MGIIREYFFNCIVYSTIYLIVPLLLFTSLFSFFLRLDFVYLGLRLIVISSFIYNLYESIRYQRPNNMYIIIVVSAFIFVFNEFSSQKYLPIEAIITILLTLNIILTLYYIYTKLMAYSRLPKIYIREYDGICCFPHPSMEKILSILLLSALLISLTNLCISTKQLDLVLDERNVVILPGSEKAININTKCNPLYPFCVSPKIMLKHNAASNGISVTIDPNEHLPNYISHVTLNVNEDVQSDEYSIGIQGIWNINDIFKILIASPITQFLFKQDLSNNITQVVLNLKVPPLVSLLPDLPNNSSKCVAGTSVKYTAILANNKNRSSMIYKFEKIGRYNISGNWSTNKLWLWETNQSDNGKNMVIVTVKDTNCTNWTKTATHTIFIEENKPPTVFIQKLIGADYYYATSSDPENDEIYFKYEIKLTTDDHWELVRDWSKLSYWSKNIKLSAGTYQVRVTVADKHHDPDKQYWENMSDTAYLPVSDGDRKRRDRGNEIEIEVMSDKTLEESSKKPIEIDIETTDKTGRFEESAPIQDDASTHIAGIPEHTETTKSLVIGFFEH